MYQPRHRANTETRAALSRRHVLGLGGLAVATIGGAQLGEAVPAVAAGSSAPYLPYTANSYFRTPVLGHAMDPARTAAFRAFMRTHPDQRQYPYPRITGTGTNRWGTTFAMGAGFDGLWRLSGNFSPFSSKLKTSGFRAPTWLGNMLTGTTDSPFCVVDTVNGITVFGTKAQLVAPRTIAVQSAGITYHSSNGLHRDNPLSNDKRNFTSRGRISDAMVIRSDLVDHGIATNTDLGHVLHLFLVETRSSDGFRSPMVGCESGQFGFGAEGERIAIDPSIDLTKRGLSPAGLVIARTLQRYGCYFGDNAGRESVLHAEQETAAHPVWRGRLTADSLSGLRWDDFVVLR